MSSDVLRMGFDPQQIEGGRPWHSDPQVAVAGGMDFQRILEPDVLGLAQMELRKLVIDDLPTPFWYIYWPAQKEVLGVVKKNYRVVNPQKMVGNFMDRIVDRNEAVYVTAGVLTTGDYWALARLKGQKYAIEIPGRKIENYILLVGRNNGIMANTATLTSEDVVCHNTLDNAMRIAMSDDAIPMVSFRHNEHADEALKLGFEMLGLASRRVQVLQEIYTKMATTPMAGSTLKKLVDHLLPSIRQTKGKDVQANIQTERDKVYAAFDDPINFSLETRGSYYNGYAAVTDYINHTRAEAKRDGKTIERSFSALLGSGADLREEAFNWLLNEMKAESVDDAQ
jgi:phage/plasmid-like protein (TIGR03299 family)